MSIYCCICGVRISANEECFELNQNYDNESVCSDCADLLEDLKSHAKSGNPLYKASRREISQLLNRGRASENGMRYCERIMEKANVIYDRAQAARPDAPPERVYAAEPRAEKSQISPVSKPKTAPVSTPPAKEPVAERQIEVVRPVAQPVQETVSKPEKLICKSCGAENLPDSMFCEHCAAQLKPQKFCRFCGGKVSPATGYCEVCSRDASGKVYRPTTDGERIMQAAGRIGESILSGASSAKEKLPVANWPLYSAALIAVVLMFMTFGKMLSIPVISSLWGDSVQSSYSLLNVSKISNSIYNTMSALSSSVDLSAFRAVAIVILLAVIVALVFYGLSIAMLFVNRKKVFTYLTYASIVMSILLAVLIIGIFGMNKYIESESSGWIDSVFKGTALLYISLVFNAFVAIFLAKYLRQRYAQSMYEHGNIESAASPFASMFSRKGRKQEFDESQEYDYDDLLN